MIPHSTVSRTIVPILAAISVVTAELMRFFTRLCSNSCPNNYRENHNKALQLSAGGPVIRTTSKTSRTKDDVLSWRNHKNSVNGKITKVRPMTMHPLRHTVHESNTDERWITLIICTLNLSEKIIGQDWYACRERGKGREGQGEREREKRSKWENCLNNGDIYNHEWYSSQFQAA